MFSSRSALAAACLIFVSGCSRETPREVERVAVIPFDNLAGEQSSWVGPAIAEWFVAQLEADPQTLYFAGSSSMDAPVRQATRLITGYIVPHGGSLRIHAFLRETGTQRILREAQVDAAPSMEAAIASLPSRLIEGAKPTSPVPAEALMASVTARRSGATPESLEALDAAIRKAPEFGRLREVRAELLLAGGVTAEERQILESDAKASSGVTRLRLDALLASLRGNSERRAATMTQLSAALPCEDRIAAELAELELVRKQFEAADAAYSRALRSNPGNSDYWNLGAYAAAYAGRNDEALVRVRRYAAMNPGANPLDSEGEIHYLRGNFAEAERAFAEAYQRQPGFLGGITLRKAAEARRLAGDPAGADTLFQRFADAASRNPALPLLQARWDYSQGRRGPAIESLKAFAAKSGFSGAWAQIAVWLTAEGKRDEARAAAATAWKAQRTVQDRTGAAMALFVSEPSAAVAEWQSRLSRLLGPAATSAVGAEFLAYALLLDGKGAEAVEPLERIWAVTQPGAGGIQQALLARALLDAGDKKRAADVLRFWPLPLSAGESYVEFLAFPAVRDLRAKAGL